MPSKKDLEKKRDELKKQIVGIDKELAEAREFEAEVAKAGEKFNAELQAAEKEVETVYKEEADKLKTAMMDDARSALKE